MYHERDQPKLPACGQIISLFYLANNGNKYEYNFMYDSALAMVGLHRYR